jgi:uncharacterized cupredoxin-like copper-binding protein
MTGRLATRLTVAIAVATAVAATGYAVEASGTESQPLGPGLVTVEVPIDHSRFRLGDLRVVEGTTLELVVHNEDPIDHELIIGTDEVHRAHERGDEQAHPPVPGEVSVAPGQVASTFYELTDEGPVEYACHLPGHLAYGMRGTIEVVESG